MDSIIMINCPFGTTMLVLCPISPFIKRVRIYNNKWIGFMFLKETKEV